MKDYRDYSLQAHNTFGIEARCRRFIEYDTTDEARQVAALLRASADPFLLIGAGSNLLLTQDFSGTVVHSAVKGLTPRISRAHILLRCGSGEVFDDVVAHATAQGWHGLENLSLIPGEVGASAVQNIGAYGAEAKDLIEEIEAVEIATGNTVVIPRSDCDYRYRHSRFKGEWKNRYLITHVTYRLSTTFTPQLDYGNIRAALAVTHREAGDSSDAPLLREGGTGGGSETPLPTAQQLRDTIIRIRREKLPDPSELGNAGSFFMNPVVSREQYDQLSAQYPAMPHYDVDTHHVKIPAAWMIDQCGWKGRSLGRAGVHDRQALVLVNRGGATGSDILALCEAVRRDVRQHFGIDIRPEVNIV